MMVTLVSAAQADVALYVHLHRGDVLQGVADRAGGGLQVVGDPVAAAVDGRAQAVLRLAVTVRPSTVLPAGGFAGGALAAAGGATGAWACA